MIPSNALKENAAFDRFSDLMAKLMIKHGPAVLKQRQDRLMEAIWSSAEFTPYQSSEKVIQRLKAYHHAAVGCLRK